MRDLDLFHALVLPQNIGVNKNYELCTLDTKSAVTPSIEVIPHVLHVFRMLIILTMENSIADD
jgi:hypothetical protein